MLTLLLFVGTGVLLAALGIPLVTRMVAPNRFYGLRVRATFAVRDVWYEANALLARDIIVVGLAIAAVAAAFFPMSISERTYTAACAGFSLVTVTGMGVKNWIAAERLLQRRRRK
jgi:hypothetical protein